MLGSSVGRERPPCGQMFPGERCRHSCFRPWHCSLRRKGRRADPAGRGDRATRRRTTSGGGRHLGHAGGQLRASVPGRARRRGGVQPGRLLVAPADLEEPDADAQPRHDLPHALLQHRMSAPSCWRSRPPDEGSITGSIDDGWQTALEDVGPAGVDKGAGGKYLILPPGHQGSVPPGYIVLRSRHLCGLRPAALQPGERQRR